MCGVWALEKGDGMSMQEGGVNEKRKAYRASRKARGLCHDCPGAIVPGMVRCAECKVAHADRWTKP